MARPLLQSRRLRPPQRQAARQRPLRRGCRYRPGQCRAADRYRSCATARAAGHAHPAHRQQETGGGGEEAVSGRREAESKGDLDAAFSKFTSASELDPTKLDYITAREFTRQELAYQALQRGNKAMLDNNDIVAMAEFRRALEYDPTNTFAMQRLRDAVPETIPRRGRSAWSSVDAHRVAADARPSRHSLPRRLARSVDRGRAHLRHQGAVRRFGAAEARALRHSGRELRHRHEAAQAVTKTFWVPLSGTQVYFLADNVENRRNFERMGLRTFYVPELDDQQLTELSNSLRVLLNLRYISLDKSADTISIRAELPLLDAADKLIRSLAGGRAEVLIDLSIFAVGTNLSRSLGTALPTQFTMFNISPALIAGLGAGATSLINQLISSGGINAANSSAISALLAQLQNSTTSSVLSQPFVTFGGGVTLFGLNAGGVGVTPTFSLNTSDIKSLEHLMLRASHSDPAVAKIGERYPIINATFAPIYNTPAIASVIGNQSYIAPFPSFNFEDLGVNLKATPYVHGNSDVTLKLELQLRSLGTAERERHTHHQQPRVQRADHGEGRRVQRGHRPDRYERLARHHRLSLPGQCSRPELCRGGAQQGRFGR